MIAIQQVAQAEGTKTSRQPRFDIAHVAFNMAISDPPPVAAMLSSVFAVDILAGQHEARASANEIHFTPIPVWDAKKDRRFSQLAEREALGGLRDEEVNELDYLAAMRRHLKRPRSGQEVIAEYEQRLLTRSLVQALNNYVEFHAPKDHSR